jgi:alkylation response protein AidB-like acyl-CoA dehydrogenase
VTVEEARRLAPRFAARAADHDRDGSFPADDFADLRRSGLFGLMVPERLGGAGAGFADYAAIAYELARGNGATALIFNMHASVTGALSGVTDELADALGLPPEALKARDDCLRAAAEGSWYAVAMSERGAGSRLSKLTTTYERTDEGFRIKGAKTFCSGAGHADAYLVAARSAADPAQVSQFLVPAGDGLTVEPTWDALGMRATGSHDVHVDVTVPATALLGGVEGLALVIAQLAPQWMVASYAAVYVGVARAAVDAAVEHVNARGLGHLPAVRARIGRADAAAPPRPRSPRRCSRPRARRRCGAGIRWNGSIATPGPARCSPRRPTCAPTGSASRRSGVIRTRKDRPRGGDPRRG